MADIFNMTDTWNDAGVTFNAIKMDVTDTASDAGSTLLDLQVGGVNKFIVNKNGSFGRGDTFINTDSTFVGIEYSGSVRCILGVDDGAAMFKLPNSGFFGWSSTATVNATSDLRLWRDAADTLAQRRGTASQTFNIYNTYTDASNYERGFMRWNADVLEIGAEAAGTGVIRRKLAMPAVTKVAFDSGVAIYGGSGGGSSLDIGGAGTLSTIAMRVGYSGITIAQRADIGFTSGSDINTGNDAGLKRAAAGKIQITDGSAGTGELIFIVPTADPGITGALWNNAGTLSISA